MNLEQITCYALVAACITITIAWVVSIRTPNKTLVLMVKRAFPTHHTNWLFPSTFILMAITLVICVIPNL